MMRWLSALVLSALIAIPAIADEGFFDSNGVKIRYVTEGEGEAVVLIHGWMSDSAMWGADRAGNTKLDASETPGFRIIAFDCRGHGKSDKPHDVNQYGVELAEDVVRLLDHLRIRKAHLIGYSMGAFIAGNVAAKHPERVLSVVYGGQAPLLVGRKQSSAPNEVEIFAKAVDEGNDVGAYILAVSPKDRMPTPEAASALAKAIYGGKDLKAYAASGRSIGRLEVTAKQLKKCKAPVLFIYGAKESDETKERVAAVHELLGRGDVIVIDNADHITTLYRPEFGNAVRAFLLSVKSR
ncbi:MAG: alpha/beta fold hydrolase [Thermoanaerobaculia bacterium]